MGRSAVSRPRVFHSKRRDLILSRAVHTHAGAVSPRALVVGAGIGGLAAAIALRRVGVDVSVFERVPEIREVGAGISLWANAVRALEWLGLEEAIRRGSIAYEVGGLRSADGAVISGISADELRRRVGTPVIVLHRADLHAALIGALPSDSVHLGASCSGFEQDGNGVTVRFTGGRSETGALLIGADGLRSVVRAGLHGAAEPRYAGCTAWRAVVEFDGPIRATETWGYGHMFGQVPISCNRVYWYAAKTAPPGGESADAKSELLELFKGWHAPIEPLITATPPSAILRNDLFDRPPAAAWGSGRVTLLGDAAHPMTPFLGQGACQALEDAVVLGHVLSRTTDVVGALRRYEAMRIPRANAFVARSRRVGQLARLRNPLLVAVRNAMLRRIPPSVQARQIARMIDFEPPPMSESR